MNPRVILAGAALVLAAYGLGGCSGSSTTTSPTTVAGPSPTGPAATGTTGSSTSSTAPGPVLAGQPGATSRSGLGLAPGYQETSVEAAGHRLLHQNQLARDTPGTQVHCPAVVAAVGTTFVCQVDTTTASVFDEPLKVDALSPLNLEFAIIDPSTFICSAHAAWVVQAMANAGMPCTTAPTNGQGQGQGG